MVAAARRIVAHFNYSGVAQQKLKSIRQELNWPNHQLVQDVITRWNSTYYKAINRTKTSCYESLNNLSPSQWELMEQCIKLLKPFEEITKITSSSVSCISEVIPHVVTLLKYLGKEETADRTPNLLTIRSTLKVELEKRSTVDDSSPSSKKRNINENDRTIEKRDSFWNCFGEIATGAGNMQNEVMETGAIANY
ncbi:hypothetical protein ILUMI_08695 [Ignelater luminosus]|uniref:Zinc finger BED domain-containing protein 4 n=1 Tax=Ignelater luminosus TaxID=2038154 RepID=A0A8K0GAE1_IGNLU|nr:hypothetical protein ILUMI_08695 [Ignelater luminosus]